MWDDQFAEFDPASGWGRADEDPSEPPADADADWESVDLARRSTRPGPCRTTPSARSEEAFADDAAELTDAEDWNAPEWDFATVAAAPPYEVESAADRGWAGRRRAVRDPARGGGRAGDQLARGGDWRSNRATTSTRIRSTRHPSPNSPSAPHEVPSPALDDVEATVAGA